MVFALGGIAGFYTLKEILNGPGHKHLPQLSFLSAVIAFSTLALMLTLQLSVQEGLPVLLRDQASAEQTLLLKKSLRILDMGIDVMWDVFISLSFIGFGLSIFSTGILGRPWAFIMIGLGAGLLVLNLVTFPFPPAGQGLFDLGPFCGIFMLALFIRIGFLKQKNTSGTTREMSPALS